MVVAAFFHVDIRDAAFLVRHCEQLLAASLRRCTSIRLEGCTTKLQHYEPFEKAQANGVDHCDALSDFAEHRYTSVWLLDTKDDR